MALKIDTNVGDDATDLTQASNMPTKDLHLFAPSLPVSSVNCKSGPIPNKRIEDFDSAISQEWHKRQEPFFNKELCIYCININTSYTNTGDSNLRYRMQEVILPGVRSLIRYYNKDVRSVGHENQLVQVAKAESWYMNPDEPNSNLKILVTIPSMYFDAISEKQINPSEVEGESNGVYRVVTFDSSDIRDQFKKIMRRFKLFEEDPGWQKYKYRYTGPAELSYGIIDFNKEATKIDDFLSLIQKILSSNGYFFRENHPDRIEIGFSIDNKVQYIFYDDGTGAKNLGKALSLYKNKEPFSLPRTCVYVFYSYEMLREYNELSWMTVLKKYTYPPPELRPTSVKCAESFNNKLKCAEQDERLKGYNKAKKQHEFNKEFKIGKPYVEKDPEQIIGSLDGYTDINSPAKLIDAKRAELQETFNAAIALDKKIDFHYEKVSEDFISFILPELKKFSATIFGGNPLKDLKKFSFFSQIYIDMINKMPSPDRLLAQAHQISCMQLERRRQRFQDNGDEPSAISVMAMEEILSCADICKAMPIICSPDIGSFLPSFPPRIDLPSDIPTIDIMKLFMDQVEGFLVSSILDSVVQMAIGSLELLADQGNRLNFDNMDLKNNFTKDLDLSLDSQRLEGALTDAGIDINALDQGIPEVPYDATEVNLPDVPDVPGAGSDLDGSGNIGGDAPTLSKVYGNDDRPAADFSGIGPLQFE